MEDRRVQRTRQYLRAALVRLMKKKPISEITVTELTREPILIDGLSTCTTTTCSKLWMKLNRRPAIS